MIEVTENGVDDMASAFQRRFKVFGERDVKALELGSKTLRGLVANE